LLEEIKERKETMTPSVMDKKKKGERARAVYYSYGKKREKEKRGRGKALFLLFREKGRENFSLKVAMTLLSFLFQERRGKGGKRAEKKKRGRRGFL